MIEKLYCCQEYVQTGMYVHIFAVYIFSWAVASWRLGLFNTSKQFARNWQGKNNAKQNKYVGKTCHEDPRCSLHFFMFRQRASSKQQKFNTLLKCQMKHVIYHGRSTPTRVLRLRLRVLYSGYSGLAQARPNFPVLRVLCGRLEWIYPVRSYLS